MCHPNLSGLNGTHPLYQSHGHWKVSRSDVKRWNPKKETTAAKFIVKTRYLHGWWFVLMCELFFFNAVFIFFQRLWNTFTCFGQMFLGRGNGGYPLTNVLKLPNFTRHHADSQRVTRLSLKIWMGCTRPVISTPYFKVLHSRVITPLSGWNTQLPNYFRPHIGLAISMYNDRLETPTLYRPHGLIGCQCLVVQFHGKKCRRNLDLDGFQEISS